VAEVLLDTNVFVDHLRGHRALATGRDVVHYSVVTRCELVAGRATDESRVVMVLSPFRELAVDRSIAERAGRLRRTTGILMVDALIAATALEHRLTLVTRNDRQFSVVPGLRVRVPAGDP
jgi:predicted nucleic acid-binding protein